MFRYEIHLHTSGCSRCGVSSAAEMAAAAKERGYAGIVFTNHFYRGNTCIDRELDWKEFVRAYERDYLDGLEAGEKLGIDVLFGIEENYGEGHEALIYGLDPDVIASEPKVSSMELPELSAFTQANGGMIYCAHPFRDRGYIPDPDIEPDMRYFDGIEVYNQFNTPPRNALAAVFAREHDVSVISGGDVHNAVNFGHSGLAFAGRVRNGADLLRQLRSGGYSLIIEDKLYTREEAIEIVANMKQRPE